LRVFDSYPGIIILISGKINSVLPAIRSRISVSIPFLPIYGPTQAAVWEEALKKLIAVVGSDCVDPRLATIGGFYEPCRTLPDLDGREIQNALDTAWTLAQSSGEKLSEDHIERAVKLAGYDDRVFGGTAW
jgi:hypothetical protein